jgi:hypothetical protein
MSDMKWADAQPGQRLAISNWHYGRAREGHGTVSTIARVTPTQLVMTDGRRFRRADGGAVGESTATLEPLAWLARQWAIDAMTQVRRTFGVAEGKRLDGVLAGLAEAERLVADAQSRIRELLDGEVA